MTVAFTLVTGCAHESLALPGAGSAASVAAMANCEDRVNDTRAKLEPCIGAPSLWQRLAEFQTIADKNRQGGHANRDTGTPGYKASVAYVAALMRKAGYRVTIQSYPYNLYYGASRTRASLTSGSRRPLFYPYKGVDYNLIADSPYGDVNRTVVVEAHLDSYWGAGMLDNASGSTSILQTALALGKTPTHNHLRFIWFGGEELGLLGSRYYTQHLTPAQLHATLFDLDVDVTASPNYDILIADSKFALDETRFPPNVVPGSKVGNDDFTRYFASIGVASRSYWYGSTGTDSNSFGLVGIPNTGVLTMQDCCRQPWEVKLWGGYVGDYEGKVPGVGGACADQPFRWCDNLSNNDPVVFQLMSKAVGVVTLELANDASLRR